jgi:hypothetical protein
MVNISDLGGMVIMLLAYVALYPLLSGALEILLPQLGPTESLIASAIPWVLLVLILFDPFENQQQRIRR